MSFHMVFGNSFEEKKVLFFFFSVYYALVSLLYLEFVVWRKLMHKGTFGTLAFVELNKREE